MPSQRINQQDYIGTGDPSMVPAAPVTPGVRVHPSGVTAVPTSATPGTRVVPSAPPSGTGTPPPAAINQTVSVWVPGSTYINPHDGSASTTPGRWVAKNAKDVQPGEQVKGPDGKVTGYGTDPGAQHVDPNTGELGQNYGQRAYLDPVTGKMVYAGTGGAANPQTTKYSDGAGGNVISGSGLASDTRMQDTPVPGAPGTPGAPGVSSAFPNGVPPQPMSVDPQKYALPGADALNQSLTARAASVAARQAPTMPGAAQVAPAFQAAPTQFGPAATAAGAQLSPAQQALAAQLGPAAQAGPANFGAAGRAGNVTISPAQQALAAQLAPMQQAQDSSFRGGQQANIDQLNRYATGQESVSQLQLRQNNEQLMAQQLAMAQSGRPGDVAMNARAAAQNMGTLGAGLAGQQALAGLQERQANAGLLATTLQGARAQDIGLNQFNVGQTNQGALAQAGFQQGANLQNAQQSNQQAIAQGQLSGQIGMTNAGLANAMGIAQGQTGAQIGMFNAGAANTQAQMQAQLQSQTALANMQSGNAYNLAGAQLGQQASQFNAGQQQQMALAQGQSQAALAAQYAAAQNAAAAQQAQLSQQAGQFGVSAGLQFQGQQDMAQQNALAQQMALAGQMQQATSSGLSAQQQQVFQQQQLAQQKALAQLAAQTQLQVQDKNLPSWFQQYGVPITQGIATVLAAL